MNILGVFPRARCPFINTATVPLACTRTISKFFSTFPYGTCWLSVSCRYLAWNLHPLPVEPSLLSLSGFCRSSALGTASLSWSCMWSPCLKSFPAARWASSHLCSLVQSSTYLNPELHIRSSTQWSPCLLLLIQILPFLQDPIQGSPPLPQRLQPLVVLIFYKLKHSFDEPTHLQ